MKRIFYKFTAVLLAVCLLLSLSACGAKKIGESGRYRILHTFSTQEMAIGFRNDDFVRYYVDAAIRTLAADGTLHDIAVRWFGEDNTSFVSDSGALEQVGDIPYRTLIVGLDPDAFPLSYTDGDGYSGFDVDCAKAVCERMGWELKFIPIKAADAYVELSSGNVDCAWGGLALDTQSKQYTTLTPYMENDIVLVVSSESGVRSTGRLAGKTLAIDVEAIYMDALDTEPDLKAGFGKITRVTGGPQACFQALTAGQADAIVTYSLAAYYMAK